MQLTTVMIKVREEMEEAGKTYPPFRSYHEGLAIIEEEFEELRKEVFRQSGEWDSGRLTREATHLAAMAIRFMVDLL